MDLFERLVERDREGSLVIEYRQKSCQRAAEVAQCLQMHRQAYGLKYVPSQVVDAVQAALRVLVYWLKDDIDAIDGFIELCRFAIILGQKFRPVFDTIQHIQALSLRGVVWLPDRAIAILDGSEVRRIPDI